MRQARSKLRWRWLVSDIDGTLVDSDQELIDRNRRAVKRFHRAGGELLLATGRMEAAASHFVHELDVRMPAILYNGARVFDFSTGTVLMDRTLSMADSSMVLGAHGDLPGVMAYVAFVDGTAYVVEGGPTYDEYAAKDRIDLVHLESWNQLPGHPVTKILLIAEPDSMAALEHALRAGLRQARLVRSEHTYLEVLPAGATKGTALRWLAADRGVALHNIAAIGDNLNDVEMLEEADLGVAVGDGIPRLKEVADSVTCACKFGAVAETIDFMLASNTALKEEAAG